MRNENKSTDFCYKCGSKIKSRGNSTHIWEIEYECGCKIWGAIDTKSHGKEIYIENDCKNKG